MNRIESCMGDSFDKVGNLPEEARAEVARLNIVEADYDRLCAEWDEKPVQKGAESNAETPDPADVQPGEAWLVECRGERRNAVKDRSDIQPWNTVNAGGWLLTEDDEDITLITRLVPEPRVITNPDELNKLADGSIVKPADHRWLYRQYGAWQEKHYAYTSCQIIEKFGPVTVLWEPDA